MHPLRKIAILLIFAVASLLDTWSSPRLAAQTPAPAAPEPAATPANPYLAFLGAGPYGAPIAGDLTFTLVDPKKPDAHEPVAAKGMIFSTDPSYVDDFYGTYINGDTFTGTIRSSPFKVTTNYLYIPITGYPVTKGNQLTLVILSVRGKAVSKMVFAGENPKETVGMWEIDSHAFKNRQVYLELTDTLAEPGGWLGVGKPILGTHAGMAALGASGKPAVKK